MRRALIRDLLAIPGGILALWSLLLILYTSTVRIPVEGCLRGDWFLGGTCWAAWVVLALPFVAGVAMVVVAFTVFRVTPEYWEDILRTGGGIRLTLVLLGSLALFPLLGAMILAILVSGGADPYLVAFGRTHMSQALFFALVGLLGIVLFAVAGGVHMTHLVRQKRFFAAAPEPPAAAPEEPKEEVLVAEKAGPTPEETWDAAMTRDHETTGLDEPDDPGAAGEAGASGGDDTQWPPKKAEEWRPAPDPDDGTRP